MKRNNKTLYEKIMRNVSKEVKKVLNENTTDSFDTDSFFEISMDTYYKWLKTAKDLVIKLKNRNKIYDGMDIMDAAEVVEDNLEKALNQAVNGNWWKIGEQSGYSDEEIESIWVDNMQGKIDCIGDFFETDDNGIIFSIKEDEQDEEDEQNITNTNYDFKPYTVEEPKIEREFEAYEPTKSDYAYANKLLRGIEKFNKQISQCGNDSFSRLFSINVDLLVNDDNLGWLFNMIDGVNDKVIEYIAKYFGYFSNNGFMEGMYIDINVCHDTDFIYRDYCIELNENTCESIFNEVGKILQKKYKNEIEVEIENILNVSVFNQLSVDKLINKFFKVCNDYTTYVINQYERTLSFDDEDDETWED